MKSIQKSIRISDDTYKIVMSTHGNGFSDKFENLVNKYSRQLTVLDEQIQKRKNTLDDLTEKISEKQKLLHHLERIEYYLRLALQECNTNTQA